MSRYETLLEKERQAYTALLFPWQGDTTSSEPKGTLAANDELLIAAVQSFLTGTGAVFPEKVLQKVVGTDGGAPIYAYFPLQFSSEKTTEPPLSAGQIVAAVRSALSLTITELASIVGVERPTIYAWLAERAEPYARNRRRLSEVLSVAKAWSKVSELPVGEPIRREDGSGVSVVELLRQGKSADAISRLKAIARAASKEAPTGRDARRERLRAFTEEHGLKRDPEHEQTAIDISTGKRMSPE